MSDQYKNADKYVFREEKVSDTVSHWENTPCEEPDLEIEEADTNQQLNQEENEDNIIPFMTHMERAKIIAENTIRDHVPNPYNEETNKGILKDYEKELADIMANPLPTE